MQNCYVRRVKCGIVVRRVKCGIVMSGEQNVELLCQESKMWNCYVRRVECGIVMSGD